MQYFHLPFVSSLVLGAFRLFTSSLFRSHLPKSTDEDFYSGLTGNCVFIFLFNVLRWLSSFGFLEVGLYTHTHTHTHTHIYIYKDLFESYVFIVSLMS